MNEKVNPKLEQFLARSVTILKQTHPDFFGKDMEVPVNNARLYIEKCNEEIPLDFDLLQECDEATLLPDFLGIINNWNICGNEMLNGFHPRCVLSNEDE